MNTEKTGQLGEDMACLFLRQKGFKIIERNYRKKFGEIDIIAEEIRTGTLVFVEVKSIRERVGSFENLVPEDNLSAEKMRKTRRICQFFANANPKLVGDRGWRIDLIAIRVENDTSCRVRHYENI